jgi:citrate synthase
LPEGLFYLMLIGDLPTQDDVEHVTNVWQRRSHVPNHVFEAIEHCH